MIGELLNTTLPTAEPMNVAEARNQLRIDETAEDVLIESYVAAARAFAEAFTGHRCVASTWSLTMANFPGAEIILPGYPLIAVDSITYVDNDGDTQTVATSVYTVDVKRRPGRVFLSYNQSWPTARGHGQDVIVNYKAGHLTPFTAVVSTDVITFSGRAFANADIVRVSNGIGDLPGGLSTLTDYHVRDQSGSTCKLAATAGGAAITITDTGTGTHFFGTLPDTFYQAMRFLVAHWHLNREPIALGTIAIKIPLTAEALLWPDRLISSI